MAKLTANDGAYADNFGSSVSLSGGTAIIGATGDSDKGSNTGSAYVFEKQENGSWSQVSKLTADDGAEGDQFGNSVSLSGDMALVGAIFDNDKGRDSGSAYFFTLPDADFLSFALPEQTGDTDISTDNHTFSVEVSYGTTVTSPAPTFTLSDGATASPVSGETQDFTSSVTYTVTAEDGFAVQDWTVSVNVAANRTPVINKKPFSVAENTAKNTGFVTVAASDPDGQALS